MNNTLLSYENTCQQYEKNQLEFRKRKDMNLMSLKDEYSIKEKQNGVLDLEEISQKENQTQMSQKKKSNPKYIVKMQTFNLINNHDPNIIVLDLSNARMTTLNEKIKQFTRLQVINLANNLFQEVPQAIFELRLSHINMNNNLLKSLQLSLVWINSLERLDVGKNHIRILPDELFQMENLKIIDLRSNDFTKFPISILKLEKQLQGFGIDWIKYTQYNYYPTRKDMLVEEDLELFWDIVQALSKNQEFITCQDFLLQNQQCYDDKIQDSDTVQIPKHSNITRAAQRNSELTLQESNGSSIQQLSYTKTLGQDIDGSDNGQNIMHIAVENEDLGIVRTLLHLRFELASQLDDNSHTPLSLAIKEEKYHCAKIIINAQTNLNIGGGEYNNVLNQAISKIQYYLIRDILNSKVQINKQDKKGNGPLHNLIPAFKKNLQEATRIGHLLIERDADPNLRNINQNTPLHLAIKKSSYSALRFAISINEQYQREAINKIQVFQSPNQVMHFAAKSENIKILLQLYSINPYLLFTYNEEQKRPFDIIQKNYTLSKLIAVLENIFINNHVLKNPQQVENHSKSEPSEMEKRQQSIQLSHRNSWDLNESDEEQGNNRIGICQMQILPNLKKQNPQQIKRSFVKKENKISCEDVGPIFINKSIQQDRNDIKKIEQQNQQNSKFNKNKFINKMIHKLIKDIEQIEQLLVLHQDQYSQIALKQLLNYYQEQVNYYKNDPLTNLMIQNAAQLQKFEFQVREPTTFSYDSCSLFEQYEQFMQL